MWIEHSTVLRVLGLKPLMHANSDTYPVIGRQ